MEPSGQELVNRYKANYCMPDDAPITEEMILAHWQLEKQLTQELLSSTEGDRWETFDRSYTRLYNDLAWLNRYADESGSTAEANRAQFQKWSAALGAPAQRIYEVGSGKGELITYLAQLGFQGTASEITRERGEKHTEAAIPNLSWSVSDGVHLDRFEPSGSYDAVISDQVLEHLHPDDIDAHLHGVREILKRGGHYIFSTPHRFSGPHDVSAVFKCDRPLGMHLKEYTYREFLAALRQAGFKRPRFAFGPSRGVLGTKLVAGLYLRLLVLLEDLLAVVPSHKLRRPCARLLGKFRLFSHNVSLKVEKA